MRVLVTRSNPEPTTDVEAELEAAGHVVLRCRDDDAPAFPCAGLTTGCPLDEGVDVAVTVRSHPRSTPAPTEDGVICALRQRVPVVVTGRTLFQPFSGFDVTEVPDGAGVAETVEAVAAARRDGHEAVAQPVAEETLARAGVAGRPEVVVTRSSDGLHATLRVPAATPAPVRAAACVRVTGALRAYDRTAPRIDISTEVR